MGTVFSTRTASAFSGDPHSHWCDGCGNYVTGPDCERCTAREVRGNLGLVTGLALIGAVGLLCGIVVGAPVIYCSIFIQQIKEK